MNEIYILIMDVDGTLTDGKIYMGQDGEIMKAFSIKDGLGIHELLPKVSHDGSDAGIIPVILTGRESTIVSNRCSELGITHVYQGISDKMSAMPQIVSKISKELKKNLTYTNIAYCGDDINDLPVMLKIKNEGGMIGCPSNSARKVTEISDYICSSSGGDGAVREFIEWLISH